MQVQRTAVLHFELAARAAIIQTALLVHGEGVGTFAICTTGEELVTNCTCDDAFY